MSHAWDKGEAEEAGVEPTEDANAPSNGFEARAPHRERYSSALKLRPFLRGSQHRFGKTENFCQKCPLSVHLRCRFSSSSTAADAARRRSAPAL
jgi:hypothetical protein